jgi:hypothetical protein
VEGQQFDPVPDHDHLGSVPSAFSPAQTRKGVRGLAACGHARIRMLLPASLRRFLSSRHCHPAPRSSRHKTGPTRLLPSCPTGKSPTPTRSTAPPRPRAAPPPAYRPTDGRTGQQTHPTGDSHSPRSATNSWPVGSSRATQAPTPRGSGLSNPTHPGGCA